MGFAGRAVALFLPLVLLAAAGRADAGTLKIAPLRAVLDSGGSAQFTLRNASDRGAAVQVEAAEWAMDEKGGDVLGPPADLVFFPKIFELDPGGEGTVRVGWAGKGSPPTERAYRLYVRELPAGGIREEGVRMLLTLSVPVFVPPSRPEAKGRIEGVTREDGRVVVRVRNDGNVHLRIEKILLTGRDEQGAEVLRADVPGWYVLAGAARDFSLDISAEASATVRSCQAEALWEGGSARMEAEAPPEGSAPPASRAAE